MRIQLEQALKNQPPSEKNQISNVHISVRRYL